MLYTADQTANIHEQQFAHLLVETTGNLFTITLNRPEKKNAMSPLLMNELAYALTHATYNRNIWAVVIAAKGDVFCAGADLKAFAGEAQTITSTIPQPADEVVLGNLFAGLHKPCIAKVQGPVYAGGFLIICGCTHVVAIEDATFSLPEVKRGIWPFQVMQSLLQIMPPRQMLDFCMRARSVNAQEAEKLGMVTKVVAKDRLDEEVQALADEIFQYSPSGIRLGLEAFDNLKNVAPGEAHKYLKQMLGEALGTEDAAEGLMAFAQKRKPVWKG